MAQNILPLGSVVTLKDHPERGELLIISRASVVQEEAQKEAYFDYGAVLIPEGMMTPEEVYLFNREDVGKVVYKGYVNHAEKQFAENYDRLISQTNIAKGTTDILNAPNA
ncbi:DUF4176 domain-containing protein [Pediococcus acidilactici]